jgi:hypothetical protein
MLKTSLHSVVLGIASGVLFLGSGSAYAFIIDDFTDAQLLNNDIGGGIGGVGPFGPNILNSVPGSVFDTREFNLSTNPNSDGESVSLQSGAGVLSVAKGPNTPNTDWFINYSGGGPIDFTAGGLDTFAFQILENNVPYNLIITLGDGTNTSTYTEAGIGFIPTGSPQDFEILYTAFTGSVDFSAITTLSLQFDGGTIGNGIDSQLNFFETRDNEPNQPPVGTPEPATIFGLMTFAGLAGASALKKKQK